jgi:FAD:protein FMN transferase
MFAVLLCFHGSVKVVRTLLVAALMSACAGESPRPPHKVERSRMSMGSILTVAVWTTDEPRAADGIDRVFQEFDRLESLLSNWKEESDVTRINNHAGIAPVKVSQDTIAVLGIAREVSELTRGKFDITFGVLADIWRFDHDQDNVVPERDLIEARLKRIDYRAVEIDTTAGTAFINRPGMRIHLGGIGKGYAVDRGIALLRGQGFQDFLIQAGGDLYVGGTDNGKPWKLAIADPRGAHDPFATIEISNGTFSTSGDYERAFVKDGKRYHHIIDPDFGEPASGCRSVTLVTDTAVMADAVAKGVFLLGPTDGMALIEKLPDVEGVIVTSQNDVRISSGLRGRLELLRSPTNDP